MKWRAVIATCVAGWGVFAGCLHAYPQSVTFRTFAAAPDGSPYVLVFDPGETTPEWKAAPRGDVPLLTQLDDVTLTCTNTPCEVHRETNTVALSTPAAGIKQLDVLVSKQGFEPVRVVVPFDGQARPARIVLLRKAIPREAIP